MGREIIAYKIITGDTSQNLEKRVTESLKEGWVPQGGVGTTFSGYMAQAVVQYKSAMTEGPTSADIQKAVEILKGALT